MTIRDAVEVAVDNAKSLAKNPKAHLRDRVAPVIASAMTDGGMVGQAKATLSGRARQLDRQIDGSTNDPTHVHFGGNPGSSTGQ